MKKYNFTYFSKNNKIVFSFSILFLLLTVIIISSFSYQFNLFNEQKKYNVSLFGGWSHAIYNINDASKEIIERNELIEQIGYMKIYGQAECDNQIIGNIGSGDSTFYQLANLPLKLGNYPKRENEILVESFVLDNLNLDYQLNQKIKLSIINDGKISKKDYIICGILENYSSNWASNGSLANIFIYNNNEENVLSYNAFMIPLKYYETVFKEIKLSEDNYFVENDKVELYYHPFSKQNMPTTILILFSICYVIFSGSIFIIQWLDERNREMNVLISLGIDNKMLFHDVYSTIIKSSGLSLIAILISFIFSQYKLIQLATLLIISVTIFVLLLIFYLQVRNYSGSLKNYNDNIVIKQNIKINKKKKITPFKISVRMIQSNFKMFILQIIVLTLLLVSFYQCSQILTKYTQLIESFHDKEDIYIESNSDFDSLQSKFINQDTLRQLNILNGIDFLFSYYDDSKYYIEWENQYDSNIYKSNIGKKLFYQNDFLSTDFMLTDIDDNFIHELEKYCDIDIDINKIIEGSQIVLYLPKIYAYDNDDFFGYTVYSSKYLNNDYELLIENSLNVGDTISLYRKDGVFIKKVEIGAIINSIIPVESVLAVKPYCVMGSYHVLGENTGATRIKMYFNSNIEREIIEAKIKSIISREDLKLNNLSYFKREQLSNFELQLSYYSVFTFIFILVVIIVQIIFTKNQIKSKKRLFTIFEQLGISSNLCRRMVYYEILIICFISMVLSLIIFSFIQYINFSKHYDSLLNFSYFYENYWPWLSFGVINLLALFIYIGFCSIYIKIINNKK